MCVLVIYCCVKKQHRHTALNNIHLSSQRFSGSEPRCGRADSWARLPSRCWPCRLSDCGLRFLLAVSRRLLSVLCCVDLFLGTSTQNMSVNFFKDGSEICPPQTCFLHFYFNHEEYLAYGEHMTLAYGITSRNYLNHWIIQGVYPQRESTIVILSEHKDIGHDGGSCI